MSRTILLATASAIGLLASLGQAHAASIESRIQALQQQIEQQQQMLNSLMASEAETKAEAAKAVAAAKASKPSAIAVMSKQNRPGWRSADGRNEIDLGALLQIDAGIESYRPGNPSASLRKLQSGINARRAQIQVSGRLDQDFEFSLQYDMGGSNEQFGAGAGGINAGLKNALLSYTGFKPWGTQLAIDFG
jgi:phosphate-selective porin OprO/OprP